jgi:hypothetical protein
MKRFTLAVALFAASGSIASAADSPFVGTWKMNVDKSHLSGETYSYTPTATGFQYSNGSTVKFDFALDGKDYVVIPGRTVSWTKSGDNTWDSVYKTGNGTVISKVHRVLSADGKTMTAVITEYRPDGTTTKQTDLRERVSGGPGLAGMWKDAKVSRQESTTMIISVPSGGHIKFEIPEEKESFEAPTDGTPSSAVKGPRIPEGVTVSYRQTAPNKLEWSYANKSGELVRGVDTVAADGKSLTSASWAPGKESEKTTEFYDKQ